MFSKVFGSGSKKDSGGVPPIPDPDNVFTMPSEEERHEGTWLQWPHNRGSNRGRNLIKRYEESWIHMTKALHTGERVHIIVFDKDESDRVYDVLHDHGCDMKQIDFYPWPTNDVWVRDNGPIFVFDQHNQMHITDWGFNGWGERADYKKCNEIPKRVAEELKMPITTIPMVNEGGSVEIDGQGTLMAKRSSILNRNRNKGWKQADAEAYFRRYLGVMNFIWLDGCKGGDITDDHIDGTARFAHDNAIVTFFRDDFEDPREYDILKNATNAKGEKYRLVHLPCTKKKCVKGDYGFYINYYIGNEVVLVPAFNDPNDEVAANILQALYIDRHIVTIPMKEVLKDGGMCHCVTQQQPQLR
jgi:agmatine deiminase